MYVGDERILAAPKPHGRGCQCPSVTEPLQRWLRSSFSPHRECQGGARGVPGVSWSRSYLLPFIFQGRSALRAELGESRPRTGPSSRRDPRGLRGTSHAQELAAVWRQGPANPLMLVTMRFGGEQEFVPQSHRF